ncbi:MAG: hypothetical protein PHD48_09295 [Alphaproteobacteria bacterium]|nr:hypothetical protein [Alphaproteobacteria bacterium]
MKTLKTLSLALVLGSLAISSPALAKKTDYMQRKDMYQQKYSQDSQRGNSHNLRSNDRDQARQHYQQRETYQRVDNRFDDQRRARIRAYLKESHPKSHCPPGLAKKHNKCTPVGHTVRYQIGHPLPSYYRPLPQMLRVEMGAPPPGTFYAMVDNDVLLVTEATKKILDAVTLLSAME